MRWLSLDQSLFLISLFLSGLNDLSILRDFSMRCQRKILDDKPTIQELYFMEKRAKFSHVY